MGMYRADLFGLRAPESLEGFIHFMLSQPTLINLQCPQISTACLTRFDTSAIGYVIMEHYRV